MRPTFDEQAFKLTEVIAERSTCPRLHVGAVIMTPDHRMVASGYNGSLPGLAHCTKIVNYACGACQGKGYQRKAYTDNERFPCATCDGTGGRPSEEHHCLIIDNHCVRTIHAEANAIAQAAKYGVSLSGCEIYVLCQPCLPCTKLVIASGIKAIHYNQPYRYEDDANRIAYQFAAESSVEMLVHQL